MTGLRTLHVERARVIGGLGGLATTEEISLAALTLDAPAAEPLTIEASGTFAGEPLKVAFRTASFDELRGGVKRLPLEAQVTMANASLSIKGTRERDSQRGEYAVAAWVRSDFLDRALPGYGALLAGVRDASAEGRVRIGPGAFSIDSTKFSSGRTRGRGEFHWSAGARRASARGRVDLELLDLAPWLDGQRVRPARARTDALDVVRRMQRAADVSLEVNAAALSWPERAAHDVRLALRAGRDVATIEGSARLHTGTFRARARLDTAQQEASFALEAQGGPVALERLHPAIEQAGWSGVARSAKLTVRSRGAHEAALVESAEGEAELANVDAIWLAGKQRKAERIAIDRMQLSLTRDAMRGSLSAAVADARVKLNLSGKRAEGVERERVVRSDFELTVRRSRRPGEQLAARGTLALDRQGWSVDLTDARLGSSRGSATVKGAWLGAAPLQLRAALDSLDLKAVKFFDLDDNGRNAAPARQDESWADIRLLPAETRLPDMDFELSAKRFDAAPARFESVRVSGRGFDGRLAEAKLEGRLAGGTLAAELSADLRGTIPQLQASLSATDFDAAGILALAGLKAARVKAASLEAKLDLRGASLGKPSRRARSGSRRRDWTSFCRDRSMRAGRSSWAAVRKQTARKAGCRPRQAGRSMAMRSRRARTLRNSPTWLAAAETPPRRSRSMQATTSSRCGARWRRVRRRSCSCACRRGGLRSSSRSPACVPARAARSQRTPSSS